MEYPFLQLYGHYIDRYRNMLKISTTLGVPNPFASATRMPSLLLLIPHSLKAARVSHQGHNKSHPWPNHNHTLQYDNCLRDKLGKRKKSNECEQFYMTSSPRLLPQPLYNKCHCINKKGHSINWFTTNRLNISKCKHHSYEPSTQSQCMQSINTSFMLKPMSNHTFFLKTPITRKRKDGS